MTGYELALTREQEISLILINFLKDPGLVSFFLKILREVEINNDSEFHCSLRRKTGDQWKRLNELCKDKQFYQMNPSIPITCDLPFDGERWRNSKELMRKIDCFFPGFIILEVDTPGENGNYQVTSPVENYSIGVRLWEDIHNYKDLSSILFIRDKVSTINNIYYSSGDGWLNKSYRKFKQIVDSYDNYDIDDWDEEDLNNLPSLVHNLTTGLHWVINYAYDNQAILV